MEKLLRVSLVQTSLEWEAPAANRVMLARKLAALAGQTDLIVLPEMFTTGFSMNAPALAETLEGPTLEWLGIQAASINAAIAGSYMCSDDGRFFNRFVFMRPDGVYDTYDKKHLFSLAGEHETFTPGRKRIAVDWKGWRICPLICYDLRFPVWSRNIRGNFFTRHTPYYDLLLIVANWPAERAHHWRSLLVARAIENQSYVAGVNLAGTDGNGLEYSGDSMAIDFSGQILHHLGEGKEEIFTQQLDIEQLQTYRKQLPFLADADVFEFKG